ncbi:MULTISPECIES: bifunctional hydroxymethylpyrimidine kinase/phosphomethylpyrimidine kinase [unclassified Neptuniibacter]|uniref:bifunctional hydroxymethylpyrimidine kinase/phosphomethylpyrimidine kinase n=1 Tax=unclassified Neptuniibacter TaxID=2630693 RepID=UPI0025E144E1|nr:MULTISPECIES: bifunctional hydroxymethylpyrimidine kinase/phosphomethylpyrimidine kinase [unclassified Neptuniibacter]
MNSLPSIANALTIAGSDSGGGAGIQADLKTFSALGVYGASVITALTAQNTQVVKSVFPVSPSFVTDQLEAVFSDIQIEAVKVGMLGNAEMVNAVADYFSDVADLKMIIDPVMISKSGNALLSSSAVNVLKDKLLPLAYLVTPNLPEVAALLGEDEPSSIDEMKASAVKLQRLGVSNVLIKGGHLGGENSPDILFDGNEFIEFHHARITTKNTHGTGCTLASAITAYVAKGGAVSEAVAQAKEYITAAIKAADSLNVGRGHGPVNHFHNIW